ncbi:TPA: hypothetical protein KEY68_003702 [Providencia rettgeri]|uniref:hypothetical protein n=1 Tax=Providencia sp. PROV141 TaxID=2949851 RepID=UPI001B93BEE8|nr:hypothetical protein [Providencia sp. PROV141]HBC7431402.1 hypothetical protein [Providencia rettgeri]
MISIIHFLFTILNSIPIIHVSNDDNYGTYHNIETIRISLLSIPLGKKIFYFLSKKRNCKKIELFKVIYFDIEQCRVSPEEVDEKVSNYELYLKTTSPLQREKQEEFLKIRIAESIGSLSSLHNKVSFYSTIGLALFGFLGYLLTEIVNLKTFIYIKWWLFSFWSLSALYALNLVFFIKAAIAVTSFNKSKFSTLRNNVKETALLTAFYRDWYDITDAVRYHASLVKNIEKYLSYLIISCVLTWGILFISTNILTYSYEFCIVNFKKYPLNFIV